MSELIVNELFYSIQGEGARAGFPCFFIRLQGCGLRCSWCDTPYALDTKSGGETIPLEEIERQVEASGCRFVELTGGEPLEQQACFELIERLCGKGYTVAIETGGHVDISRVDARSVVIMDMKCPGSGMMKKNRIENLEYLKPGDEVKFVIRDRADYEWAKEFVSVLGSHLEGREVLFSPVFGVCANEQLARWILDDKLNVRMQLQLHKYIWDPAMRGV